MAIENGNQPSNVSELPQDVHEQLAVILSKLDDVQRKLEIRNRRLAEFTELQDDLAVVAKDMFQTAVVELDEVAPFIQTGDFLALMKRSLRNVNRISEALSTLESAADFVKDAEPISHDLFHRFILQMDHLEQKGYFRLAADVQAVVDTVVETLAKTDVLPAVERGLKSMNEVKVEQFDHYSLIRLYRDTKRPEVRRLMGLAVTLLTAIARELPDNQDQAK